MRLFLIAALGLLVGCGGAPKPDPRVTRDALARYIPADALYWTVYVETPDAHSVSDQLAESATLLHAELKRATGSETLPAGIEPGLWRVLKRLDRSLKSGRDDIGLGGPVATVFHPLGGAFPTWRLKVAKPDRLRTFLVGVAEDLEVAPVIDQGALLLDALDVGLPLGLRLTVALQADLLTLAVAPAAVLETNRATLLGRSLGPALAIEDLAEVAKSTRGVPTQVGAVMFSKLADLPVLEPLLGKMSGECRQSLRTLLGGVPRVLLAWRPSAPNQAGHRYVVELADAPRRWIGNVLRPAPAIDGAVPGVESTLSLGLDEDALRAGLVALGYAWLESPSDCDLLTRVNAVATMLAMGIIPPANYTFGGVTGVAIGLGRWVPEDDDQTGAIVAFSRSPAAIRDFLAVDDPGVGEMKASTEAQETPIGTLLMDAQRFGAVAGAEQMLSFAHEAPKAGPWLRFMMSEQALSVLGEEEGTSGPEAGRLRALRKSLGGGGPLTVTSTLTRSALEFDITRWKPGSAPLLGELH